MPGGFRGRSLTTNTFDSVRCNFGLFSLGGMFSLLASPAGRSLFLNMLIVVPQPAIGHTHLYMGCPRLLTVSVRFSIGRFMRHLTQYPWTSFSRPVLGHF